MNPVVAMYQGIVGWVEKSKDQKLAGGLSQLYGLDALVQKTSLSAEELIRIGREERDSPSSGYFVINLPGPSGLNGGKTYYGPSWDEQVKNRIEAKITERNGTAKTYTVWDAPRGFSRPDWTQQQWD